MLIDIIVYFIIYLFLLTLITYKEVILVTFIKEILDAIILQFRNIDFSLGSMFIGFILSKLCFNYIEVLIKAVKKYFGFYKEYKVDKLYKNYKNTNTTRIEEGARYIYY